MFVKCEFSGGLEVLIQEWSENHWRVVEVK